MNTFIQRLHLKTFLGISNLDFFASFFITMKPFAQLLPSIMSAKAMKVKNLALMQNG